MGLPPADASAPCRPLGISNVEGLTYIGDILKDEEITASAPCRVDVSGTWDLKAFALPYESISPSTTNIALSLRTTVRLRPYKPGWIFITDVETSEEFPQSYIRFDSHFGMISAIVSHFSFHGLGIEIAYQAPPKSGLGGSGTLAVAVIAALSRVNEILGKTPLSSGAIAQLAHDIEDGLRYSYTGLQDQCAAAFGGVNRWTWRYSSSGEKFTREVIITDHDHYEELESRVMLCYLGRIHDSREGNEKYVLDFFGGQTKDKWFRINQIGHDFAEALKSKDWESATGLLREENEIRCSIFSDRITPFGRKLQKEAEELGFGFGSAGVGDGGCVWALGDNNNNIEELRSLWESILAAVQTAHILDDVKIDRDGLIVR